MSHKKLYALTYAERASFAHVLCTANSTVGQIGTGYEEVFGSDANDATRTSNVSSDITWAADTGTFTFARAGIYHIVFSAHTQQETANRAQTFLMGLNSATPFYASYSQVNTGFDPVESTHQTIVSISANDVLHIQMKTGAGTTATIVKGTSVTITEITSGHYASQQVTADGTTTTVTEYNPFDDNLSGNPSSYTTVSAGMTVTGTVGSFTANAAGRYLIMVSNNMVLANAGGGNGTITMKLKKNGTAFATRVVLCNAGDDPAENTFCLIENLADADVLTMTWSTDDGDDGDGIRAAKGSNFTVFKLHEEVHTNGDTAGFFGYPYISIQNTETDYTASNDEENPFIGDGDDNAYDSENTFDTRTSSGITFTNTDGKFTVSEPGLYAVYFAPIFTINSGEDVDIRIKVNGTEQVTSTGKVSAGPDPLDKTVTAFLELNKNDAITITVDVGSDKEMSCNSGTSVAIFRYFGFFKTEDTVADGLISDDFTINTFSQGNLSAQYERSVDQVPFKMGIRGALNLRGRPIARPSVVKLGDKKN